MAKVGLKYPVYSPLTETATTVTYGVGGVMARAIKANISVNVNDEKLYADNGIAESDKSFKDGKITYDIDELSQEVYKTLLAHTEETPTATLADTTAKELIASTSDNPAFFGTGFYGEKVVNGVTKYRAIWLKKVQFAEINDENETKGETTKFSTPSIEGTIYVDVTGEWKREITVATEADAIAWLNDKAGIA